MKKLSVAFLSALSLGLTVLPPAFADRVSLTEADQLVADAESLGVISNAIAAPVDPVGAGLWSGVIGWTPHIPVSAAQLPDGRLLTWAGESRTSFNGADSRSTYAAVWNPATGQFTEINNTNHDMFCGGTAVLPDGRIFVNGGDGCNSATSTYDWRTNRWTALGAMNDIRWYNPSIALPDGGVFTVTGNTGDRTAERWDAASGWRRLSGIDWLPVLQEPGYVKNWHPFIVLAPDGRLFHFGPTDTMRWITVTGTGSLQNSGQFVPGTHFPKEGAYAMFEEGRILVAGGAATPTSGADSTTGTSTGAAYVVDLNGPTPVIQSEASMNFPRQFANSVVLPNGEVMIMGGNGGVKFSDAASVLTPELWNPRTRTWRQLANMTVPRNYHSTALLLADGRVWAGGGGLGGGNHQDAQIFTPPALLNANGTPATRPVITGGATTIGYGQTFNITATAGLAQFAFIRMSSLTHSVNTDLRRLVLPFTETSSGNYQLTSHSNINVMTPGYWMLFALNSQGVYSQARTILVSTQNAPSITSPGDQQTTVNAAVNLTISGLAPTGTPVYTATGLPPGLQIASATGRITGTATASGLYQPSITITAAGQSASATFRWTVLLSNLGSGSLLREYWTGIGSGVALTDLTNNANFPHQPSGKDYPTSFQAPTNVLDAYGERMRGYLYAPVTGTYQFYIASDDNGRLLLSPDDSPTGAVQIASVPDWTSANEWTRFPQQASAPITLQAGQRYYIEALMKEGGGGDNLSVGWIVPGSSNIAVIPGSYLSPFEAAQAPVAGWNFEQPAWTGAAGDVVENGGRFSGTAINLATTSNSTPALTGNPGTGRYGSFTGGRYVRVPGAPALAPGDFTVAAWVRLDAVTSPDWRGVIVSREAPGSVIRGFGIYAGTDGRWYFFTGSTWSSLIGPTVVANRWVHVAATFRTTSISGTTRTGVRRLFIDGVQVGQDTGSYVPATTAPLLIGASEVGGAVGHFMLGSIDEPRIFAEPLSLANLGVVKDARHPVNVPPGVNSPGDQLHVVGSNVSLNIPAADPDADPLTFSATNLPPGLTIDGSSGVIFGAPTTAGSYAVTIRVEDAPASGTEITFTWTIREALTLPALSGAPIASGTNVALSIAGTGGVNARYTWNFGDGTPDSAWSTSGSVAHTFPGPGRYLVTVTAEDDTGRVVTSSFWQLIHAPLTAAKPAASTALAFVPSASGNARLWVANPDADTATVLDAVTGAKLAEIAVAASPRCVAVAPDGRIWITAAHGDAISVVNATTFTVEQTLPLPRGSRPFGLAFQPDGEAAWVALEDLGQLIALNVSTGAVLRTVEVGPHPRHISVSADSTRVLASRFITPLLPGESTGAIDTAGRGGEVVIVNAATGAIEKTAILQHSEAVESQASARGIPNYLGAPVISPDGLSAWIPSKQDNIKRGQLREGSDLPHDGTVRAIASKLTLPAGLESYAARVDFDNSGVPSAAAFDPFGGYLYVALEASQQIAIVDVWNAKRIAHYQVGRAPQAVEVSPDGTRLFVQNFMDRTVTILDVTPFRQGRVAEPAVIATTNTVAVEKLTAQVLRGKQLFYDAADNRLALESYISCASCHNDGGHDGRTWDFTGFGEGLRNTPTLRGHGRQGPSHWTGNFDEVQDFENQIRGFAGGVGLIAEGSPNPPLGAPNAGRSADLDALAAYVDSLTTHGNSPAPAESAPALAGRDVFIRANCASCHSGPGLTNSALGVFADIGTIKPSSGQRLGGPLTGFDVPTLRGLWNTAPYLHDGSAATLTDAIAAHRDVNLSATERDQLAAFLLTLDDSAVAPPANTAPTIVAPAPQTSPRGGSVNFPITASDPESQPLTFIATGLPAGLTIDASTGVISGVVAGQAAPANLVRVSVTDGFFSTAIEFEWNVTTGIATSFADEFDAAALDLARWSPGSLYAPLMGVIDPQIPVAVQGGRLTIAPRAGQPGANYRGVLANWALNLTGATASAEVTSTTGKSFTWFGLGRDRDSLLIACDGGTLYCEQSVDDVSDFTAVPYVPAQHRFWRIRHDSGNDRIIYEAGPDGVSWTPLRATARRIAIDALRIELVAGTYDVEAAPGVASFDRVLFTPNRAPVLTNPGPQTLARGQAINLQIPVADPDGQTLQFAAAGLPAGLAIDSRTGLISGVVAPEALAVNNASVAVTDGLLSDTISFVWNVSALPATWSSNDLGAPAIAGSASFATGTYTITGSGSDIGGTSDQFHYVWQPFVGDGEFIARVPTMTNPDSLAKAGVMLRETLQPDARFALMAITPGPNMVFLARSTTGGTSTLRTVARYKAPNNWVRLVREGDRLTGYRSQNGTTWTQLGTAVVPMSRVIYAGLAVTSRRVSATGTATFDNVRTLPGTLPEPWLGNDVGTPALTELDHFAGGTFTVKGGGAGISARADAFKFISQTLTGDGSIVARVVSQSNTDPWAKAGVMIRESSAANSPFALMTVTQSYSQYFQSRASAGATALALGVPRGTGPYWLRLVRVGNVFTGYRSIDGVNWTLSGSATINMGATVSIGLAVTSHNNALLSTATFSGVQVTPANP